MAHPGGRPTKYNAGIVKRAQDYLDQSFDTYEPKTGKLQVNLPSVEGLAIFLDIRRDTLYEWALIYPEFSDTLAKIKERQKNVLLGKGLSGEYNSTIAKLVLSANHDMREKTDTDITTKGEALDSASSLTAKFADEVARRLKQEKT